MQLEFTGIWIQQAEFIQGGKCEEAKRCGKIVGCFVNKQGDTTSRLRMKCRSELEKLEKLSGALEKFREHAQQTVNIQILRKIVCKPERKGVTEVRREV